MSAERKLVIHTLGTDEEYLNVTGWKRLVFGAATRIALGIAAAGLFIGIGLTQAP